jgi:signal peptidase I
VISFAVTLLVALFTSSTLIGNFRVEGTSMEPTFQSGEMLFLDRAAYFRADELPAAALFGGTGGAGPRYLFGGPRRGDVAVFHAPTQSPADYLKRIIALPGDTIVISAGQVLVNGERLDEPYVRFPATYTYPTDGQPEQVPQGYYFVLGDNRPDSFDSHLGWLVSADALVGRAWVRYWPPAGWAIVSSGS